MTRASQHDLMDLFAPSLGDDKARQLVLDVTRALALPATLDRDQILAALTQLESSPGLVGTVARFVRLRVVQRA